MQSTFRIIVQNFVVKYRASSEELQFFCWGIFFNHILSALPPLGHIWDVMLVWRKGNIKKTVSVLQYCVLL